jgi:hypothetical protein
VKEFASRRLLLFVSCIFIVSQMVVSQMVIYSSRMAIKYPTTSAGAEDVVSVKSACLSTRHATRHNTSVTC